MSYTASSRGNRDQRSRRREYRHSRRRQATRGYALDRDAGYRYRNAARRGESPVAALTYAPAADTLRYSSIRRKKARWPCGCPRGRKERLVEGTDKQWRGSPLDVAGSGMDAYGIKEIVIEFDNGDEDIFTPKQREEFESYELHQMAAYLDSIGHSIRKGEKK